MTQNKEEEGYLALLAFDLGDMFELKGYAFKVIEMGRVGDDSIRSNVGVSNCLVLEYQGAAEPEGEDA